MYKYDADDDAEGIAEIGNWLEHMRADADFRECMIACNEILRLKGSDYNQGANTETSLGSIKSFYALAERNGLTAFQVFGVMLGKQNLAVETFLQKGNVESEPIESRIHDVINYMLLLYKMVQHEKRKKPVT